MRIPLTQLNDMLRDRPVTGLEGLEKHSEEVRVKFPLGTLLLYHQQDCCESFWLEDFEDDRHTQHRRNGYDRFIGLEVTTNQSDPPPNNDWIECYTWTYVRLKFQSGDVTLRFCGSSNGYYSEECDIMFDGKLVVDAGE
jgi:hypothetical protein